MTGPAPTPVHERILSSIARDPSGCWLWEKSLNRNGYGQIGVGSRSDGSRTMRLAHRVSFEAFVGEVPDGLDLDHQCHTSECKEGVLCVHRSCVNPLHLLPATRKENVSRGYKPQLDKRACSNGHTYTADTLYFDKSGARCCRICSREKQKKYYNKTRQ